MRWPDRNHERGMQLEEAFVFELGPLITQCLNVENISGTSETSAWSSSSALVTPQVPVIIHFFPACLWAQLLQQFRFASLRGSHPSRNSAPLQGACAPRGCPEVVLTRHSKLAEPTGTFPKSSGITLWLDQVEGFSSSLWEQRCGSKSGHPECCVSLEGRGRDAEPPSRPGWTQPVPGRDQERVPAMAALGPIAPTHAHHGDCFTYSVPTCK